MERFHGCSSKVLHRTTDGTNKGFILYECTKINNCSVLTMCSVLDCTNKITKPLKLKLPAFLFMLFQELD